MENLKNSYKRIYNERPALIVVGGIMIAIPIVISLISIYGHYIDRK